MTAPTDFPCKPWVPCREFNDMVVDQDTWDRCQDPRMGQAFIEALRSIADETQKIPEHPTPSLNQLQPRTLSQERAVQPAQGKGLGDLVESALSTVGVTKERVEKWMGKPCGCKERQEKLNAISSWALRVVRGSTEKAKEYLDGIIGS